MIINKSCSILIIGFHKVATDIHQCHNKILLSSVIFFTCDDNRNRLISGVNTSSAIAGVLYQFNRRKYNKRKKIVPGSISICVDMSNNVHFSKKKYRNQIDCSLTSNQRLLRYIYGENKVSSKNVFKVKRFQRITEQRSLSRWYCLKIFVTIFFQHVRNEIVKNIQPLRLVL